MYIPKAPRLIRTIPPDDSELPVSLEFVKAHCRLPTEEEWDDDDALLTTYILAAEHVVCEQAEVQFREQEWKQLSYGLCGKRNGTSKWIQVTLGVRPCTSIEKVEYIEKSTLDTVEVDPLLYRFTPIDGKQRILLNADLDALLDFEESQYNLFITMNIAENIEVPHEAKLAISMLAGHYYRNREAVGTVPGIESKQVKLVYDELIDSIRFRAYP